MRLLLLLICSSALAAEPLWPEALGPLELEAPAPLPSLSAQTCNACRASADAKSQTDQIH